MLSLLILAGSENRFANAFARAVGLLGEKLFRLLYIYISGKAPRLGLNYRDSGAIDPPDRARCFSLRHRNR